jgi:peptidylprolyl isomerase
MRNAYIYVLIAVLAVAVVSAVLYMDFGHSAKALAPLVPSAGASVVAPGDTVQVYYTGTFTNGTVFGSNVGKQPLVFIDGANQLIEGFDQGVVGMGLNETKTITVPADEGYGEVNPNLIIQVPISEFKNQTNNRTISVGMNVTTENSNGQQLQGIIKSVNATTVTVDFNPPLAGQTLIFSIKVVGIQSPAK